MAWTALRELLSRYDHVLPGHKPRLSVFAMEVEGVGFLGYAEAGRYLVLWNPEATSICLGRLVRWASTLAELGIMARDAGSVDVGRLARSLRPRLGGCGGAWRIHALVVGEAEEGVFAHILPRPLAALIPLVDDVIRGSRGEEMVRALMGFDTDLRGAKVSPAALEGLTVRVQGDAAISFEASYRSLWDAADHADIILKSVDAHSFESPSDLVVDTGRLARCIRTMLEGKGWCEAEEAIEVASLAASEASRVGVFRLQPGVRAAPPEAIADDVNLSLGNHELELRGCLVLPSGLRPYAKLLYRGLAAASTAAEVLGGRSRGIEEVLGGRVEDRLRLARSLAALFSVKAPTVYILSEPGCEIRFSHREHGATRVEIGGWGLLEPTLLNSAV